MKRRSRGDGGKTRTLCLRVARRPAVTGCLVAGLVIAASLGPANAADRAKAARGMGYANYVYEKSKCDGAIKVQAVTLQNDISNFYGFSYDDLLGKTELGASVGQGRAEARHDETHPEYKGQFCDSMDEVLSLWRSDVLPSPK